MSFIGKILAFIGGGSAHANRLYIVEGGRLAEGRGGEKLSPRDQVQLLHQIARFAKQEEVKVQVVFEGHDLREVANGGEFNGVTVFFTDKAAAVADLMIKLARAGGRSCVVITADRAVESRAVSMGFKTMRASTLKKAMEGGGASNGGGEGGGRGERFGRGQRQRRPQRQRFQQQSQQQQASQSQPVPSAQQPAPVRAQEPGQPQEAAPAPEAAAPAKPAAPESKVDPAVRNLIDLVE